jgi:hypothetical protein
MGAYDVGADRLWGHLEGRSATGEVMLEFLKDIQRRYPAETTVQACGSSVTLAVAVVPAVMVTAVAVVMVGASEYHWSAQPSAGSLKRTL